MFEFTAISSTKVVESPKEKFALLCKLDALISVLDKDCGSLGFYEYYRVPDFSVLSEKELRQLVFVAEKTIYWSPSHYSLEDNTGLLCDLDEIEEKIFSAHNWDIS